MMTHVLRFSRFCRSYLAVCVCFDCVIDPCSHTQSLQYKRSRKISSDPIDDNKRSFLTSLLQVILTKMKWDPDADPDDVDEDDNAEFDKIRKVCTTNSYV